MFKVIKGKYSVNFPIEQVEKPPSVKFVCFISKKRNQYNTNVWKRFHKTTWKQLAGKSIWFSTLKTYSDSCFCISNLSLIQTSYKYFLKYNNGHQNTWSKNYRSSKASHRRFSIQASINNPCSEHEEHA